MQGKEEDIGEHNIRGITSWCCETDKTELETKFWAGYLDIQALIPSLPRALNRLKI